MQRTLQLSDCHTATHLQEEEDHSIRKAVEKEEMVKGGREEGSCKSKRQMRRLRKKGG